MKKIKLVLISAGSFALLTTSLTGCRGVKEGEDEYDPTKANIVVATLDKGIGTEWLVNAAREFEELYKDSTEFEDGKTGVKVSIKGSDSLDGEYLQINNLNDDIYFTEGIAYRELINKGKVLDITSTVNEKLTAYGENKSIMDKIEDSLTDYLTVNGKIYGVPFYDSFYGLVYDMDLWNERQLYISKTGQFVSKSGDLSLGTDHVAGTLDDGLPATYEEFGKLITKMKNKNITPYICSNNGIEYTANYLYNIFADYEGLDNMRMNITLSGTANDLINLNDDGTYSYLPDTPITEDNGYMLQKQEGRYKTLKLFNDTLISSQENYICASTHIVAQHDFIFNKEVADKPIGMIVEGSWWENEARYTLATYQDQYKKRTNYAIMPIPFENETKAAEKNYKHTYLSLSHSFGLVSSSTQNRKLALEFMKFLHTDKMLSKFTRDTSITRPLNYEITAEDQANLSTYAKSLIDLKKNSNVFYPYSSNQLQVDNNLVFNAFNWTWNTMVDGIKYRHPWMYFSAKDLAHTATPEAYFKGQYSYFESVWEGLNR